MALIRAVPVDPAKFIVSPAAPRIVAASAPPRMVSKSPLKILSDPPEEPIWTAIEPALASMKSEPLPAFIKSPAAPITL